MTDSPAATPTPPTPQSKTKDTGSSQTELNDANVRETLLAILIAFMLAFIFRAYLVEPFVIPTGSMNPTLKGLHAENQCSDCGYRFHMDILSEHLQEVVEDNEGRRFQVQSDRITDNRFSAKCPMCGFEQPMAGRLKASGDRILVDKFEYAWSKPSRWDVVVFKNPQSSNSDGSPGPTTNYIKRLIGLPDETVYMVDGDIYTSDDGGENFQIARKTDPASNLRWKKIQDSLWQPIYHSYYYPRLQDKRPWNDPWRSTTHGWTRDRLGYHFDADQAQAENQTGDQPITGGQLTFDFGSRQQRAVRLYPYNQATGEASHTMPVEDVRIGATFVPQDGAIATLGLSTTSRLDDLQGDQHQVQLLLDASGTVQLLRWPVPDAPEPTVEAQGDSENQDAKQSQETDAPQLLISVKTQALVPGQATRIELWVVDQSILIWRDEKLLGRHLLPTPGNMRPLAERKPARTTPSVSISLAGGNGSLTDIVLDRDVYYESRHVDTGSLALGGLAVGAHGWQPARSKPIKLGPEHFFCMGDNPPRSSDCRFWRSVEPFVQQRYFDSVRNPYGIIPKSLLIGRAFFVYLPAPYPIHERTSEVRAIPNLGDMRFIH